MEVDDPSRELAEAFYQRCLTYLEPVPSPPSMLSPEAFEDGLLERERPPLFPLPVKETSRDCAEDIITFHPGEYTSF